MSSNFPACYAKDFEVFPPPNKLYLESKMNYELVVNVEIVNLMKTK